MSGVEGDTSTYTVTYKPGASGSGAQQTATKTHGVALTLTGAIFTRSGYTQTGWATSDGGTKAYDLGASYTSNAAITLYPYWTENKYTVTYKPGASGSGAQQTATKTHGVALTLKGAIFTRSGYTQTGWATSDGGTKAYDLGASYTSNVAITLYPYRTENFGTGTLASVQLWEDGPYWATTNIGAEEPWEYGYYFWWGDTVGYTRSGGTWEDDGYGGVYYSGVTWVSSTGEQMSINPFDWDSCPTMDKDNSVLLSAGYIDLTGNLAPEHDAARVHWGGGWRMPTDAEFSALVSNCTTTWISTNGVYGRLVTGKGDYASRSIFLPAAGYGGNSCLNDPGSCGHYWSSSLNSDYSDYAWSWYLSFNFNSGSFYRFYDSRYFGQSVRPVRNDGGTVNTYRVTYSPGASGSGTQQTSTKIYGVSLTLKGAIFTRSGYRQTGWSTSDGGAKAYDLGASYMSNAAITLYPCWKANSGADTHGKVQLWEGGPYWATTNIGAEEPWEYGYYFWWGDTVGYKHENDAWMASDGSSSNFLFEEENAPTSGKGISALQDEGWITADNVLAPDHDAAHVQWGDGWRMPTDQELRDLNNECDWTWMTMDGVDGYLIRGRGNYASASIFLPAAGYGYASSLCDAGWSGHYSSSIPFSDYYQYAWDLYFYYSDYHDTYINYNRYNAQTVRPVQSESWGMTNTYTVTYNSGTSGSGALQTATKKHGVALTLNGATFTRSGYTQTGWATTDGGEKAYTLYATYKANAAITLYPYWTVDTHNKVQLWEGGPYWADTNIGAEKPWEYGYYFWWGDTVGFKREGNAWSACDGSSSNFDFQNNPISMQLYNQSNVMLQRRGWITADDVLAPQRDAAQIHWGGGWRMPTEQELEDLINNCDWIKTTMNGVHGYLFRGRGAYTSASIFLPSAGYGEGSSLSYAGSIGYYWSSVPDDDNNRSWSLYFCSDNAPHGTPSTRNDLCRYDVALSVRPVLLGVDGLATYTVTYNPGVNGRGSQQTAEKVHGVALTLGGAMFTRSGYRQTGWSTSDGGTKAYDLGVLYTGNAAITLYPYWTENSGAHNKVQLWEGGPYWAETNIGAEDPWEYGYYFWWGDTVGYTRSGGTWTGDEYYGYYAGVTWVSSTGKQMSSSPFDYGSSPTYGKDNSALLSAGYIDATGNLVPKHDAAHVHWGGAWRMPTDQELSDLIDKCDWTWTRINGVNGYVVSGRGAYVSTSIFLPAAAYGHGTSLYSAGSGGRYWSCTPYTNDNNDYYSTTSAWFLDFSATPSPGMMWGYMGPPQRYTGLPVRPVMSGIDGDISTYTVTYKPGASGSGSQQIATKTHGVALTLTGAIFTRSGYTQTGWATSDGGSKAYDLGASYIANAAITLYPYWTANLGSDTHDGVQLWEGGPYWATTNVGAEEPWEYGYYFWWGDTVGYTRSGGTWTDDYYYSGVTWVSSTGQQVSSSPFSSSSCPTFGKDNSTLQSAGYIDSTGNLVAAHDAATAHLGAPWRMPTDAEFSALINNCTTTWITTNGVYGRLVTGNGAYADRSIFLPAAGYGYDSCLDRPGSIGYYWSSSPNSNISYFAWSLYFYSGDFYRDHYGRYYAQSVRPVRDVGGAVDTYTVTYKPGASGSGSLQTATKTHGVALTLKGAIFTRSGYTQTGWATSDGGTKAYDLGASYTSNAAITLYPYWTATDVWTDEWTDPDTGYTWTYRINGDTAEIFCYDESLMDYGGRTAYYGRTAISPYPTGSMTVPSMLGGKPVTRIGNFAFNSCSGLTSVTIPDGVTSIGDGAFYCCSSLTSVTIPDSVTSIEWGAFSECADLTSVTIPSRVTSIEGDVFWCCYGLTSVTIPDGVTSIGEGAFEDCRGLTSVTIPNSVTNIGFDAFSGCNSSLYDTNSIPGVRLVDGWAIDTTDTLSGHLDLTGVRGIGAFAFSCCSGLTSVTIPDGVTRIGAGVFGCCSGLTSVTIPSSVTSIGEDAFYDTALATVHVEVGDTDRVKSLIGGSGYDVSGVTFIEDVVSSSETPDSLTPDPVTPDPVTPDPVSPNPVTPDPATPGYEVIEATDIIAPYEAPKAVTLQGVIYDGGKVVGIVELKLGKVNAKKGTGKVSGSVSTLDGKKHTIKAFNLEGIDGTSPKSVTLEVKDFGTMTVTIGGTQFAGSMGKYHVQSAAVGGDWSKGGTKVYVDVGGASGGRALPEGTIEDLLPDGEPVIPKNGKWKFAKAASVKWAKPKQGAVLPERYDAESGKGLLVDTSGDKTNLSAMKLTYTPKKGTFKGSFKVYALEGSGKATKLKKYTIKVSGVVVGGVGHGTATCKKPAASWSVTVR